MVQTALAQPVERLVVHQLQRAIDAVAWARLLLPDVRPGLRLLVLVVIVANTHLLLIDGGPDLLLHLLEASFHADTSDRNRSMSLWQSWILESFLLLSSNGVVL